MFWDLMRTKTSFIQVINGVPNPYSYELSFIFEIFVFIGIILAISIHEFSHAWVAHLLGDDTAKYHDRMNINPFKHFDKFGFFLLLFAFFSYGKPVPVNPNNFKNPIQGNMLVSLAGPMSNILQAIICAILFLTLKQIPAHQGSFTSIADFSQGLLTTFIYALPMIGFVNIALAIFNLLPIFPLDGSKIWGYISPKVDDFIRYTLSQYSFFVILFLIVPIFGNQSILSLLLQPVAIGYFQVVGY
jgi:Zn-dependent protease